MTSNSVFSQMWKARFAGLIILIILTQFVATAQNSNLVKKNQGQEPSSEPKVGIQDTNIGEPGIIASSSRQETNRQTIALNNLPTPIYSQYVDQANGTTADTLIKEAMAKSRDLMATRQNLAIINGRLIQAGLRPNPTVDSEYTTDKVGAREGEYNLSLSYIQPIERGGKRAKRRQVAQLELEQAEKEVAFQERQITAEINSQYAGALAATEGLRFLEQLRGINEQMLRVTEERLKEGDAAKLDVSLIRLEVSRLRVQQIQAENTVKTALLQLKTLAGLGVDVPLKLRGDLTLTPTINGLTLEGLQAAALQSRADLQAARKNEEVTEARINLAEAEAVPDVSVFGRYQQDKSIFSNTPVGRLSDVDKKVAVGVSIPLPLFNRNQGAIAEAVATRTQAQHRKEFLEQLVKRDVSLAFTRLQTAKDAIQLYESEILSVGQETLRMVRTAYDLGELNLLEVVAEQRRLLESQQQYIDVLKEYRLAVIELERAVGTSIR